MYKCTFHWIKVKNAHAIRIRFSLFVFKVTSYILKENSIPQKTITTSVYISIETANKIIKCNLKLIKILKNMIFTTNASMHYETSKSISIGKNRNETVIETIPFKGALPKVPRHLCYRLLCISNKLFINSITKLWIDYWRIWSKRGTKLIFIF